MNTPTVAQDRQSIVPKPLPNSPAPRRNFPWLVLGLVIIGLLILPIVLTSPLGVRALIAVCFAGVFLFLLRRAPAAGVAAVIGYLCVLGGLRRWLIPVFDWIPTDPLVLAMPLLVVAYPLVTRRNYQMTKIQRWILVLLGIMAIEVVNPLQGGIAVGLSGVLFYVIPVLWYFVGRQVGTPAVVMSIVKTLIFVAITGALYGLSQTYFGFLPAEVMWLNIVKTSYAALNVADGVTRAFSYFTSAQEYSVFLTVGIVVSWALFLRGNKLAIVPIPLIAVALFLESARGPVVITLVACAVLWVIQGKSPRIWLPRGIAALLITGVVAGVGLRHLQSAQFSNQTQALLDHQTSGLLTPGQSTAGAHTSMVAGGILMGFKTPIGMGLGATTSASKKFGGTSMSTEADVSNMFVDLGFIGGTCYLGIIILVLTAAFRYWQVSRNMMAFCLLAVLIALLGSWLNGGEYAASTLSWLAIGILDRQQSKFVPKAVLR